MERSFVARHFEEKRHDAEACDFGDDEGENAEQNMMMADEPEAEKFERLDHAERNEEDEKDDRRRQALRASRERVLQGFERNQRGKPRQRIAENDPTARLRRGRWRRE